MHSVRVNGSTEPSVADYLIEAAPYLADVGRSPLDGGLVHRLDQMTSGILIGAKSEEAWQYVHQQFQDGTAGKHYFAALDGRLNEARSVTAWMGSRYRSSRKMTVISTVPGKAPPPRFQFSETHFEPLLFNDEHNVTIARVTISTGRRHQIRAHAALLRTPLFGDKLYGSKRTLPSHFPDFLLHCAAVSLKMPDLSGWKVSCPAPAYWDYFGFSSPS